ncbi:MAG TPA: phosphotransferase, partial [Acidimicrobiales bacterium]|nr:phosphotransferase [Acidimicrobiales bacterium]
LALTSLRDLLGHPVGPAGGIAPADAGGDFAAEAERLGEMTAKLHVAMSDAFGTEAGDPSRWVGLMRDQLESVGGAAEPWVSAAALAFDRVLELGDVGVSTRVHGDYHLGQVMRTDSGWFVLDFEGEPARPIKERRKHRSPLKDVAGMLRSFHYAGAIALRDRMEARSEEMEALARAWEEHNRAAFLEGYLSAKGVADLLPSREADILVVLTAFEMDKAIYELAYERAHRPGWETIPLAALTRDL